MAPRRARGPRPPRTWDGRRREGAPRCSSGGSPSRAAAVTGPAAADAPVAPSSAVIAGGRSSASSSSGYFSPRDEVSTSSLQPPCMSSPTSCSPQQPGLAACVADADGADEVVGASSGNPSAALPSSLPEEEEPLLPALQMEVALPEEEEEEERLWRTLQMEAALQMEVAKFLLFYFDAHKKGTISSDELKSIPPAFKMEVAIEYLFRLDLASKKRILSADELDLIIHLKSQLPYLEAEIGEVNSHGAEEEEEEEMSVGVARGDEMQAVHPDLDLAVHRCSEVPICDFDPMLVEVEACLTKRPKEEEEEHRCLEVPLRDFDPMLVEVEACLTKRPQEEEEEEEVLLSPLRVKLAALKIMFRLDLAREMRTLSADELDLYDVMKSLLPHLEAKIGKDNANGVDAIEEEKAKEEVDNADEVDAIEEKEVDAIEEKEEEEEEKPLSPAVRKEVAIEILFQFDLARKKRTLSARELDLISFIKSQLARLEAEIEEVNEDEEEEEVEEEEEEEPLPPALEMEAALKMMFRLDLAREMRTLSADELDLYDDMKSLLSRLEAEIREAGTAPSITLEDPPSCQLHAPSIVPLAGANEVLSPMVPSASTFIKLSADLQLAEHSSVVATNAELSGPGPEATPSVLKSSAEPEPAVEDDEITEALYRHSVRRHRLQIFRDICPE